MKLIALSLIAISILSSPLLATDLDDLSDQIDELNSKLDDINNSIEEAYYQTPEGRAEERAWEANRARIDARHEREELEAKQKEQQTSAYTLEDMKRWRRQWAKLGKWDFVAKADARIKEMEADKGSTPVCTP